MELWVWGLSLGSGVPDVGSGFGVWDLRSGALSLGSEDVGLGFWVWGLVF